jgi:capsular exopolysaccharide synthesis family protein
MIEPSDSSTGDAASSRLSNDRLGLRLHRLKSLIIRYWWIIALTVMIGVAVQGYRCTRQIVRYISSSRMMVSGHVSLPQGETYSEELPNFYGTQVALMKSRDTVAQSVARVRAIYPEVAVDKTAIVDAYQEPRTSIFDLQVTSINPEYAKLLLDAVMDTYLASRRGRKAQTTNEAVLAITGEISHLDTEIQNDEQQLLDFQKQNNVAFVEEQNTSTGTYLVDLNNERARLIKERDLLSLESKDSLPSSGNDGTTPNTNTAAGSAALDNSSTWNSNASVVAEQENIEKLKILRDKYGVYLKDMHPKMIALSDAINKEEKFLELLKTRSVMARDSHRKDLEFQIKNLEHQIVEWNNKSLDLSQRLGTYEQLKSKITREQALYNQLASNISNVNVNKSLDQEDIVTMEPASPASAISPDYPHQLIYGFFYGLSAGLAAIYFINRLDDKIDSPLDLEENIEFPLIGQIPLAIRDKRTKCVPLLSETDQRHALVESHRNIRSLILFQPSNASKPRSLLISSAIPNEGKSTLTANLAITFSLSGIRTLLIDADLRRGIQHTFFEAPVSPGLAEYFQQENSWHEVIRKTRFPNLDLMTRGKVSQQAGDLLLGSATDLLFQESITEYDMVLVDSAPILAVDDAANLCSKVDGILFVARVGCSSIHLVRSALEEMSQRNAKILGIVLNAIESDQPGYYDKYRYKQYYATKTEA